MTIKYLDFALKMKRVLNTLQEELDNKNIAVQHVVVLFDIASHPDTSVGEISKRCGLGGSVTSRAVAALSGWSWTKKDGMGLIEKHEDIYESRRRLVRLSQQGSKLMASLMEAESK